MRAACRQAVKPATSSDKELLYLLESFRKRYSFNLSHGRPIIITITKYELEKCLREYSKGS